MTFSHIIKLFLKNKLLFVLINILAISIGVLIYKYTEKQYESVSKFVYIEQKDDTFSNLGGLAQLAGLTSNSTDVSTYVKDIIHSNDFLTKLIETINLKDTSDKKVNILDYLEIDDIDTNTPNYKRLIEQVAIAKLQKRIIYSKDRASSVISISTIFSDPYITYQVNLYILNHLNNIINDITVKHITNKKDFLKLHLDSSYDDLRKSENQYKKYLDQNIVILTPSQKLQEQRYLREIDLKQEIYIELFKQYQITRVKEAQNAPLIEMIDCPIIPIPPVSPKKTLVLLMSLFSGLVLSISIIVIKDWFKTEVIDEMTVESENT